MYTAKCFYSVGWGLMVYNVKASSYRELNALVDSFKGWLVAKSGNLEKIVYSYPSGKSYIARG